MVQTSQQLTQERRSTHGDYPEMCGVLMDQLRVLEGSPNWDSLPDPVKVYLINQAQKTARILTGNPYEPDHYRDVQGYAYLAQKFVAPESVDGPVATTSALGTLAGSPVEVSIRADAPLTEQQTIALGSFAQSVAHSLSGVVVEPQPVPIDADSASSALAAAVEGRADYPSARELVRSEIADATRPGGPLYASGVAGSVDLATLGSETAMIGSTSAGVSPPPRTEPPLPTGATPAPTDEAGDAGLRPRAALRSEEPAGGPA